MANKFITMYGRRQLARMGKSELKNAVNVVLVRRQFPALTVSFLIFKVPCPVEKNGIKRTSQKAEALRDVCNFRGSPKQNNLFWKEIPRFPLP